MNESDEQDRGRCCEGNECCATPDSGRSVAGTAWKTLAFVVVMLLAVAVSAYSLFWRADDVGSPGGCSSGSVPCNTPCVALPGLAGLDEELAGVEFALIVLPGSDADRIGEIAEMAAAAASRIKAAGTRTRIFTLDPGDPAYKATAEQFKLTGFPAVLLLGTSSQKTLTQDQITEEAMLTAYRQDAAKLPACCAGKANP